MNETLQSIAYRKSCRSYQTTPLPSDVVYTIATAGIQAPSSMNRQQTKVTVISNTNIREQLTKEIAIALDKPEDYSCFYHAPCIMIVSAPKEYDALVTDGSCVLQNIFLAATSLGIGSCWINQLKDIADNPAIRELLTACKIPEDHIVCGCASLGYPQEDMIAKEKKVERISIID